MYVWKYQSTPSCEAPGQYKIRFAETLTFLFAKKNIMVPGGLIEILQKICHKSK